MENIREVTIYNPDNIPVNRALMWGGKILLLPKGAEVLFFENHKQKGSHPIPHILIGDEEYKHCPSCHKWKRITEFYKHHSKSDGYCSWCADCSIEARKIWRRKKAAKYRGQ